jgi:hypothetical protein
MRDLSRFITKRGAIALVRITEAPSILFAKQSQTLLELEMG